METVTCPHCGKQNDIGDATCIHCAQPMSGEIGEAQAGGGSASEPAATGSAPEAAIPEDAGEETPVPEAPAAPVGQDELPSPPGAWPPAEAPKKGRAGLWLGLGVAAVVIVALLAVFTLGKGSATAHIPSEIAGVPRLTSPEAQQAVDQITQTTVPGGGHLEAGLYGANGIPRYVMVLFADPPSEIANVSLTDQFDQYAGLLSGSAGAAFDTSGAIKDNRDGVEYVCIPLDTSGVTGNFCLFHKDQVLGGLIAVGPGDPQAALDTTQQAYEAATG